MAWWLMLLAVLSTADAALPLVTINNDDVAELDNIYINSAKAENVRQGCIAGDYGGGYKQLHIYCLTPKMNRFRITLEKRINSVEIALNQENSQFVCDELQPARDYIENYLTTKEKRKGELFSLSIQNLKPPSESLACVLKYFDGNRTRMLSLKPLDEIRNIHITGMGDVFNIGVSYDKNYTKPVFVFDLLLPSVTRARLQYGSMFLKAVNTTFPMLTLLELYNGNITSLPKAAFKNVPNIENLIIRDSDLKDVDIDAFEGLAKLSSIDLRYNAISMVPEGVFRFSPRIWKISLAHNSITDLNTNLFTGLSRLQTIFLNKNKVELKLHNQVFSNLRILEEINLESNGIRSLPEDVFRNSTRLQNLILSDNKISELPQSLFFGIKLRSLILNKNLIKDIPVGLFTDVKNLETLDLGNNMIEKLENLVFFDLKKLKKMDLAGNRIKTLVPDLFVTTPNIEMLFLSDNGLIISSTENTYPPTDLYLSSQTDKEFELTQGGYSPFQNLLNLKRLYLNGNNVSVVCTDWRTSHTLEILDLSFNTIPFLRSEDMHFRSPTAVIVTNNNIKYFDPHVYESKRPIPRFIMRYNPYNCSCPFLPFIQKYSDRDKTNFPDLILINATCAEPEALRGKGLDQLTEFVMDVCSIVASNASAVEQLGVFTESTPSTSFTPMEKTPSSENPLTSLIPSSSEDPTTITTVPKETTVFAPGNLVNTSETPKPDLTVLSTATISDISSTEIPVPMPIDVTIPPPTTSSNSPLTSVSPTESQVSLVNITVPSSTSPNLSSTSTIPTEATVPAMSTTPTTASSSQRIPPTPTMILMDRTPEMSVSSTITVSSSPTPNEEPKVPQHFPIPLIPNKTTKTPELQDLTPKNIHITSTIQTSETTPRNHPIFNININYIINSPNNTIIVNPSYYSS